MATTMDTLEALLPWNVKPILEERRQRREEEKRHYFLQLQTDPASANHAG